MTSASTLRNQEKESKEIPEWDKGSNRDQSENQQNSKQKNDRENHWNHSWSFEVINKTTSVWQGWLGEMERRITGIGNERGDIRMDPADITRMGNIRDTLYWWISLHKWSREFLERHKLQNHTRWNSSCALCLWKTSNLLLKVLLQGELQAFLMNFTSSWREGHH